MSKQTEVQRPKRHFTAEFKKETVALYERIGGNKAGTELDVNPAQIRQWRKKLQTSPQLSVAGKKNYSELAGMNFPSVLAISGENALSSPWAAISSSAELSHWLLSSTVSRDRGERRWIRSSEIREVS